MSRTVVVLEVQDDSGREWYESIGLPEPWRWHEVFPQVYVREVLVRTVATTAVTVDEAPS